MCVNAHTQVLVKKSQRKTLPSRYTEQGPYGEADRSYWETEKRFEQQKKICLCLNRKMVIIKMEILPQLLYICLKIRWDYFPQKEIIPHKRKPFYIWILTKYFLVQAYLYFYFKLLWGRHILLKQYTSMLVLHTFSGYQRSYQHNKGNFFFKSKFSHFSGVMIPQYKYQTSFKIRIY